MRIRFCLLWLLLAPLAVSADQFDSVRAFIRRQMVETSAPSLAVAVARDGKILWEEGFGWADREKRIAATEHTLYSLASISKPITATGLMVLVQAGKIDLDRPVNDYLGDAKLRARVGDAAQATVRRVANHTSGLPLHYQFFYADEPYRRPSMDETILRYGNLVTVPGEKYEYSNLGFGILDYVIARTSGRPYEDFMRQEVFQKLGLTHTSVGIGPGLEKLRRHALWRGRTADSVLRFRSSRRFGHLRQRARPGALRPVPSEGASARPGGDPLRRLHRRDAQADGEPGPARRIRNRLGHQRHSRRLSRRLAHRRHGRRGHDAPAHSV